MYEILSPLFMSVDENDSYDNNVVLASRDAQTVAFIIVIEYHILITNTVRSFPYDTRGIW